MEKSENVLSQSDTAKLKDEQNKVDSSEVAASSSNETPGL